MVFNKYHIADFYYLCARTNSNHLSRQMKKKFLSALEIKCKDMGLTKNALDELTEIGAANLKDDATDDDINAAVDSLVPYAKAMQAETTRKTSRKPSTKQSTDKGEGNGEGESKSGGNGDDMPEWAKAMQTKLDSLVTENAQLKAERTATERAATIAEKAKSLGIPEYLLKRMTFADDADIDAELTSLKQDLVNNNLMPKGQAHEGGSTEQQDIADAEAWAASLSNRE
nr:MAG TPA: hypothetical protein [Caudoviricetes sp.]